MKFYGRTKEKRIKFDNIDYLNNFLRELPDGQFLSIEIGKRQKNRTNPQNSMYWGYILAEISKETGHTTEELHFLFKRMFLPRKYIKIGRNRFLAEPTTTKENTVEFTEYIERIQSFAATELGIIWDN
jgi:hypothetical protein